VIHKEWPGRWLSGIGPTSVVAILAMSTAGCPGIKDLSPTALPAHTATTENPEIADLSLALKADRTSELKYSDLHLLFAVVRGTGSVVVDGEQFPLQRGFVRPSLWRYQVPLDRCRSTVTYHGVATGIGRTVKTPPQTISLVPGIYLGIPEMAPRILHGGGVNSPGIYWGWQGLSPLQGGGPTSSTWVVYDFLHNRPGNHVATLMVVLDNPHLLLVAEEANGTAHTVPVAPSTLQVPLGCGNALTIRAHYSGPGQTPTGPLLNETEHVRLSVAYPTGPLNYYGADVLIRVNVSSVF
jgi:hypothetical protein